ncbi:MAG: large conductance mechanosensitive channel protein MscL [Planctomycetota bacterium]|jgi:large conductance mechanosensitive channel
MDLDPLKKMVPTRHAISLLEEFKKFAFKGNMIDLAVALVVGTAFTQLVNSFVKAIIMPTLAQFLPGPGAYTEWKIPNVPTGVPVGQFLGELVNFLIVSFAVFIFMVKILGLLIRKEEQPAPPPPLSKSEELLVEIRDLLRKPTN